MRARPQARATVSGAFYGDSPASAVKTLTKGRVSLPRGHRALGVHISASIGPRIALRVPEIVQRSELTWDHVSSSTSHERHADLAPPDPVSYTHLTLPTKA